MKNNYKKQTVALTRWLFLALILIGFNVINTKGQVTTYNYTGTIVTYTVPGGVTSISIDARGAEGGIQPESNAFGPGKGARMMSVFSVTPGQVLNILVGGQPANAGSDEGAGGGGGSFVTTSTNTPLLIAGGGGGEGADAAGVNANITTNGTAANTGGAGGTNGNGGFIQAVSASNGSAGGGLLTDGLETCLGGRGRSFLNGGLGGISCGGTGSPGGFGGGGGGSSEGGGGGGGYSGGGGADGVTDGGGGGGSYNAGLQQLATAGFQSGNGQIIITELTTSCVAPTAQPTGLVLSPAASFQINGSFTGDPSADSYLIVRYAAGATPSQLPIDGVQYATGTNLGNGIVVTSTTASSFQATGLTISTSYDFYVYSMNGICGGGPLYYTPAPLFGNASTPAGSAATALGGLWSSPATWAAGAVPPTTETVIIPAGSIVTVDQLVTAANINLSGILQWNGTTNAMTITGNLTISATGRFLPYTAVATPIGQTVNIGGNFTNNGYANCALGTGTQCLINFNGAGSVLSGSGVFEGDGTRGIIRQLFFQNLGSNSISTTQNITTYSLAVTAGSLNTNGNLRVDNGANVYGLPVHTQVSSVAVTAMGSNYSVAPVVFGVAVTQWNNITGVLNTMYVSGTNVYRCVAAANIGPAAPTHTSGIAQNLLWIGTTGTLGTPFLGAQSHSVNTQYFYGDNLYVCTTAGAASTTSPPTHTSGIAASGAASFRYVGSPAKVSVNYDATTLTVRSLALISGGSGYSSATAPGLVFSVGVLGGTGSGASAFSVIMYNNFGPANSLVQRSGVATITGGLTINNDQGASVASADPQSSSGVAAISTANGGNNYSVAPQIAFGGPLALNLITNPGSGYTAAPTITVSGGTLVAGSAYTSSNFTITVNQGTVQSVYLTSTTAVYSVPPTLTMSAPPSGTTATLAFPAGCWPAATANIGTNGQLSSFTMTNAGYGYNTAPTVAFGPTSGTPQGGTFTTAATAPTSRIASYNLTLNYFTPAASAVVSPDDVVIPSNRKLNNLSLAGNGNGLTLTGGDLILFGTSPLTLAASLSSPGNILNLNGNNLHFTWNGYAGATNSTFNNAGANCYVKNGSITLTGRGGAGTFNFPFAGNTTTGSLTWFVGSTPTAITTGCNATKYTVTELGAPTNATYGSGAAMGNRSYRAQLNAGSTGGTNPTITLHFNSLDGLTTTQDQTFVAEASAQSGPWTVRSTAYGASAIALPAAGSKATTTAVPGPINSNGDNYYAFATTTTTVTNFSPANSCGGGTIVITGSGFTGATAVTFGGTPALSFTVNSSTQITAVVSNSGSTGLVSVTSPSGTGISASTYTFDGVGPIVSIAEGSSIGICTGNSTTLTALPTGSGETYLWSPNAGGATTQQITVNTAGTYSCTITNTGGCFNVATATVFIDDVPSLTITSTPPAICSGQSATLSGTAIIGAPGVATVGTSTTTISGNDGNPYRSGNGTGNQIKVQLLYTAAELTAAGLTAGPITSIGFTTTASSTGTVSNFEIRIGSSSATALTTTFQTTPLTLVFTQASFTPLSSGVNTHVFNQGSFTWDGISNIIVQTCQTNNVSGTATVQAYTPAFLSNTSMQTSTTSCSSLTGTTPAAKPIITFGGIVGTNVASSLTWVWQPGNLSGSTQIVSPGSTTTYNVTATNSNGCSNTGSIEVQVSPTPVAPVISGGLTVCGQATTTLTSTAPGSGNAIEWFDVASGGTPIFTGTAFTTPILTASKTYYVQETGPNCFSTRTPVTVTWNIPPTLAIYNNINNNTANVSFCGTTGIPVVGLSATTGSASSWATNGSTFSWSESHPGGLSCAGTCTASNSVDLNNILPAFNNENIILTANDPVLNCISSVAINVTAFTFPAFNAQATPPNVCTGGSTELSSGVSSANFAVSSIAYDAIPVPPTATVLCNGGVATTPLSTGNLDDGGWYNIPIGFNLNYFGNINTTFNVSTNGNIQFGATGSFSTSYTPGAIPTTAVPNNFVAMCWSDIYLTGSGTIRYFTTGSTPNRICVIDWSNCVFYNSGNPGLGSVGGQILLYETTGVVEVHLTTATGLALGLSNGQKSLGLENAGGTVGAAAPGRNGTAWQTSVPEAWRFQPPVVYTFDWTSIPSGFTSSLATPTVFPTSNTQYVVLVTDPITGCTKNDTILVEVNPIPSVAVNPTSANVCSPGGTAAQLTASGDPADYSWSPAAGLDATTGAVVNALPSTSTNYVVTATTLAGCTATASAQVNVTQGPTVNVTATPPSACVGSDIQLEAIAITSGYSMNINCSTGFIDISTTGTSIGAVGDDTEHYISIPAFTFNSVSYTDAVVGMNGVIVLGATSGDITLANATLPTTTVAAGNVFLAPYWDDLDINLGATVVYQTVGNNFIIQWTNTDHNLFTTGGITFQVQMNLVTGIVTFVYPDAEFGSSTYDFGLTATIGIQMNGTNAVQYSSNSASLTSGQCISFTPVAPNVTYDWSTNATYLTATNISNPVAENVLTSETYTVIVTDLNTGCINTQNIPVSVTALPEITKSSNAPVCENQDINLVSDNTASGQSTGNIFTWTGPGGFLSGSQNPTISAATAANVGWYYITVQNSFGCSSVDSLEITINENPDLNILSQTNVACNGALTGAYTIEVSNPIPFGNYLYNDGTNTQFNDGTFTGVGAGTYNVEVTDDNSCSTTIPVTITEPDPTTTANAGTDQSSALATPLL
ncbi:MAG: hypothetical protein IPI23_11015 [Bacteroidetes bacterium]|nr:hypothetical protein [Bacteroidota bacterium]